MYSKAVKFAVVAVLIATAPVPVLASDLGAAIVGGIIGGALMNNNNNRQRTRVVTSSNSPTRQAHRETQTALNYFGFPAGTPDGVFGQQSRNAAAQFQAYVGYPATGNLLAHERAFLLSSYNRALIGGTDVARALKRSKDGTRGLLVVWNTQPGGGIGGGSGGMGYAGLPMEVSDAVDEIAESTEPSPEQLLQRAGFIQTGDLNNDGQNDYVIDTSVTGSTFWCGQTECATILFVSAADGYQRRQFQYKRNEQRSNHVELADFACDYTGCRLNDPLVMAAAPVAPAPQPIPQPAAPAPGPVVRDAAATLPSFGTGSALMVEGPSLASFCSKVNLMTSTSGGFVTVATMTNPKTALSEQFCLGRTYAIARGEDMVASLQGVSLAQVEQQCDAFGPAMAPFIAQLNGGSADQVLADVQRFAAGTGMNAAQLAQTGEICLFTGYRRDKMDVALGSALLLVAAGQKPYAELVGHHVSEGFGAARSESVARSWYSMAIDALEGGAQPAFAPDMVGRTQLLRAAAFGAAAGGTQLRDVSTGGAQLPTFGIKQ